MKIGVVGAGSIGLLFASYLQEVFDVTLYTRTQSQADEINRNGIYLKIGNSSLTVNVRSEVLKEPPLKEDLVIVSVKQYQLEAVLAKLRGVRNLLFLQNGMGHLKALSELEAENIFVGSVEHGALRETANSVSHNGKGVTRVAVYRGSSTLLETITGSTQVTFPFVIEEDYYQMLTGKLTANAVINPLTAILRVKNGELIYNRYYEKTLEVFFAEVADILCLPDKEAQLHKVKSICRNTAENRSSMLKDLEAGRKTEVEAILGYLAEEACKTRKKAPLIECFYNLIKGLEWNMREGLS